MKTHSNCPACDSRVSIVHLILAPTPMRFRCGSCKAPISVHMRGLFLLMMVSMAVAVGLGLGLVQIMRADGLDSFLFYLGLSVAVWLAIETGIALLVLNHAELDTFEHFKK